MNFIKIYKYKKIKYKILNLGFIFLLVKYEFKINIFNLIINDL